MRATVVRRVVAAVAAVAIPGFGAAQTPSAPDRDALLSRIAAYLETYEKQFSAVVADEDYRQAANYSGGSNRYVDVRSDIMVLNAGGSHWVQIRDVYEVDKRPVRDHQARLLALLESPNNKTFGEAEAIANESARYNLGVHRNINVPTMALMYSTAENQPRSRFELAGAEMVDGVKASILKFQETVSPSLIRDDNGDVATAGRDWVDPLSGAILRTELTCVTPSRVHVTATIAVDYGHVPAVPMLVPTSMGEKYRRGQETDTGKAVYSKFRSFEVDTSAFFRRGGGR